MELYLSIVNFSKTGFLPNCVVRSSNDIPIIVFKETCKETKIEFLQIQFHINGYSIFYVCVKSQTQAHSSTSDNKTRWSSTTLSAHSSVLYTSYSPLQHNQFVLISSLLYHPQAKFPQFQVKFLWMQCFLHGEWVFGFVVYTDWLLWPVLLVFSLMQGSYLLSLGIDGIYSYWRSWQ